MWHQGARTALVISCCLLAACGAKTLDFNGPDGGSGGAGGGTDGGAGSGGAPPGPYVGKLERPISKIDLLFMIDNSPSMADKQPMLGEAIPNLVDRLMEPLCIDPITRRTVGASVNGVCTVGSLAFEPVKDIHIGIISSSLGAHGAAGVCEDQGGDGRVIFHNDDRARLLTRGVEDNTVPTFNSKGFLYFNPAVAGGLATARAVAVPFTDLVKGVGSAGCRYSAPLEAVYRFLIDPDPYDSISIDTSVGSHGQAVLNGTDQPLLQQRAAFLRPDSLVSVVLVTDRNDCSIADGGQGFYSLLAPSPATRTSFLERGTSKCLENPNDRCCFNCGQQTPPAGCAPATSDPECSKGPLTVNEDQPGIRCFNQKQRYGVDFMYPVQRYIDGFSKREVPNRQGQMVPNPLYSNLFCPAGGVSCVPPRDKSLVRLTGIVGVPWQDIAVDSRDLSKGFKTAKQLHDDNVWANIVGDPLNASGPIAPGDRHMIESIQPRQGLAGPGSDPRADLIHGHEWDPSNDPSQPNADLQYACIFDLILPRTCVDAWCDCTGSNVADTMKPVCQDPQGAFSNIQTRGKAYPGTRVLQVLQGLGDQAIVGSICPANVTDKARDDYGYSPVRHAVIDQLRQSQCLPIALPVDTTSDQTTCGLIEVHSDGPCVCDTEPGRRMAPESLLTDEIKAQGNCRCEIKQLTGDAATACRTQTNLPGNTGDGWCYVDPAQQSSATCNVVQTCPLDQQRRIRFSSANSEPRPGAATFLRCDRSPITPLPPRCP